MDEATPVKRPRGRPRKNPVVERDTKRPEMVAEGAKFKMRARPNWVDIDPESDDSPDRLRIPPHLIPSGMSAVWVTDSVYGQAMPQHRAEFEKKGWTPVHGDDFDGIYDGMFMPKGSQGEINVEGMVLMMRPKEITDRAKVIEQRRAREAIAIKEASLRGGDLPGVNLDTQHPSALKTNRISKTVERIEIPKD